MKQPFIFISFLFMVACSDAPQTDRTPTDGEESWTLTPFVKIDHANPCLLPSAQPKFFCPVRRDTVGWEEKDVFNPTAVIREGQVHLIYRAEDTVGKHAGTSRLGLAVSDDGYRFTKREQPIFYPDNDQMKVYEWEGGCEDPRIIETEEGRYFMTYTAWDGQTARLCIASSDDLINWQKHGLVLGQAYNGKYKDTWSKSGAIVARREGEKLIAQKINGKYWMYWGDTNIFICTSEDLVNWLPLEDEQGALLILMGPRKGKFDSRLVEPGPSPLVTDAGIVFIYNGMNRQEIGNPELPEGTYAAGQVLIDKNDPTKVIDRSDSYFMKPDKEYEIAGQVNRVCFVEGLVPFKGKWLLYYGTADSKIAVAEHAGN